MTFLQHRGKIQPEAYLLDLWSVSVTCHLARKVTLSLFRWVLFKETYPLIKCCHLIFLGEKLMDFLVLPIAARGPFFKTLGINPVHMRIHILVNN